MQDELRLRTRMIAAGDELLCWATAAVTAALRPADVLGRLGRDEFAVLLPAADLEQGTRIAERLQLALSARISASFGVADAGRDGDDGEQLYRRADDRLYDAKRRRPALVDRRAPSGHTAAAPLV